jgi:hypothetical protein
MRRIGIILFASLFILSGCFRPSAVAIIDNMYTEAIMEENEADVLAYFSDEFLEEIPSDQLIEEVLLHARDVGGIQLLNTAEIREGQLNPAIREELNESFQDNWHFIVNEADGEHVMTWVVVRRTTHYEIVDGEKLTAEDYRQEVLN